MLIHPYVFWSLVGLGLLGWAWVGLGALIRSRPKTYAAPVTTGNILTHLQVGAYWVETRGDAPLPCILVIPTMQTVIRVDEDMQMQITFKGRRTQPLTDVVLFSAVQDRILNHH